MNTKSATRRDSAPSETEHKRQTETAPELFVFIREFGKLGHRAELGPELLKRRDELLYNAKYIDSELARALDMCSKISHDALDNLVTKRLWLLLAMPDEDCESEFGEHLTWDTKASLVGIMSYCCEVVLQIQKSLGAPLQQLLDKDDPKRAETILSKQFLKALSILAHKTSPSQKVLSVTKKDSQKVSLALAAIEVAQDLATQLFRAPTRLEVQSRLEELYRDELITIRDQGNRSHINWSELFASAGLKSLPTQQQSKSTENNIAKK